MMGIKDGIDGGPIALFDAGTNAVFMTPFNSFMVATPRYDKNASTYGWGIVGEIQKLPPQYKVETILYYSDEGIREVSTVLNRLVQFNVIRRYVKTNSSHTTHRLNALAAPPGIRV